MRERKEPPVYSIGLPPESTGDHEIDEGERKLRALEIRLLERGESPQQNPTYLDQEAELDRLRVERGVPLG
jgi:hypothetical protein